MQGHLLVQNRDSHAVPFSMGIEPSQANGVLPLNQFLKEGFIPIQGHNSEDCTPIPSMELLEDEVVFITQQVATRLRVHPAKILKIKGPNSSTSGGNVIVERLDPSCGE